MSERYLEDFVVGQTFGSGRLRVTKEQIKAFAAEFDPQPFHLDEAAAQDTFFQGLAASGWHTSAPHHETSGRERAQAGRWRHWRRVRRIPFAEACAAGGRTAY